MVLCLGNIMCPIWVILLLFRSLGFCLFLFPLAGVKFLNRSFRYAWKFCLGKEKNKFVKIPEFLYGTSI